MPLIEAIQQAAVEACQRGGGVQAAIGYLDSVEYPDDDRTRGRVLNLRAKFLKRMNRFPEAFAAHREALSLLTAPQDRIDALVSLMDLCYDSENAAVGIRYGCEAESILDENPTTDFGAWPATFQFNMGRLCLRANDHDTAVTYLERAVVMRKVQSDVEYTLDAMLYYAEALMMAGRCDEAEAVCRDVRLDIGAGPIRLRLCTVQARVAIRRKDLDKAQRLLDQADAQVRAKLGEKDYRRFVDIWRGKAELAEAQDDFLGAKRLRSCVVRMQGA